MTETNAITVSISGKAYLDRPGSCGQPNHMWDLRILDDDGNVGFEDLLRLVAQWPGSRGESARIPVRGATSR